MRKGRRLTFSIYEETFSLFIRNDSILIDCLKHDTRLDDERKIIIEYLIQWVFSFRWKSILFLLWLCCVMEKNGGEKALPRLVSTSSFYCREYVDLFFFSKKLFLATQHLFAFRQRELPKYSHSPKLIIPDLMIFILDVLQTTAKCF